MKAINSKRSKSASGLKMLTILVLIPAGLVLAGCSDFLTMFFKDTDTMKEGTVTIKGIEKKVTVRRDDLGIPFIDAENADDLVFAVGYVNAVDRLNQMIGLKLMAQGRLAEMAGPDVLDIDIYMRTLNLKKISALLYSECSDELKKLFESYSRGVNFYLEENRDNLPPGLQLSGYTPEEWKPEDSISIFALLNLGLAFNFHEEINSLNLIKRLGPEKAAWLFPIYPDEKIPFEEARKLDGIDLNASGDSLKKMFAVQRAVLDFTQLGVAASNNWAISKEMTKGGASILANDTHLPLSMPSVWHLMHIRCPEYEAAGIGIAGLPAVVAGYNGYIGWGMTMVMADNQDIYLEKLKPVNGKLHYQYKDKWFPTTERKEHFKIRGEKPVTRIVHETVHGTIMNEILHKDRMQDLMPLSTELPFGIALKWAAFEQDETLSAFLSLGKSKSVSEAEFAAKKIRTIPLNLIFADKDNIAWQVTGRFPLRKKGRGLLPSPGWDGEYDWQGYLDVSLHPRAVNPPEGYVATANNRTISPDESFILSSSWEYPERIERITELIESTNLHTMEDSTRIQNDLFSALIPKLKNTIFKEPLFTEIMAEIQSWSDENRKANAQEAIRILKHFNGNFHPDSAEAPILGALLYTYTHNTFLDELGPAESTVWQSFLDNSNSCYSPIMDQIICRGDESPFWDNITTPEIETKAQILSASFADVIPLIEKKLGTEREKWQWGKMHTYHFKTETTKLAEHMGMTKKIAMKLLSSFFDRGPYPAGGSFATINIARYSLAKNFDVWLIPEMRIIVDFSKEEPLMAINSTGQSDNPVSPHYEDGIHAWREGRYQPFPFKKDNIEKQYHKKLTMLPVTETGKNDL